MKLQIRKDVEDILPGFFPKLKLWQYITLIAALGAGAFFALASPFSSGTDSFLMAVFAGVPGAFALFNKRGLDAVSFIKHCTEQKVYVPKNQADVNDIKNRKEKKDGPMEDL